MALLRFLVRGSGFFGRKWLEAGRARSDSAVTAILSRAPERVDGFRTHRAARRPHELSVSGAIALLLLLLLLLGAQTAWADHAGPGTRDAGGIGLGWLFLAGLLIVLGLAAWALLAPAPDDEEPPPGEPGPRSP